MFAESLMGEVVPGNQFPMGMRVLAVDDDQFCLKILENLLHRCKYHVTTTTKATEALEMLKENINKFDLLISDVDMPGIDGFKLLEQVEPMNLPVILLSDRNDKEWVKKSVIHGACYYLRKPVRIEELKNIWQHVLRKKIDCMEQNKVAIEEKIYKMVREGSQSTVYENNAYQNKIVGQKRKKKSEEGQQDDEKNGQENETRSSKKKKPRLVWVEELHTKFVDAINQLGIEKAYPKSIVQLMNVEGLTREHVASHLQKYKVSLKESTKLANPSPSFGLNLEGVSSSTIIQPVQSRHINSIPLPMCFANDNLLGFSNHSSVDILSSYGLLDNGYNGSWQNADQLSNFPTNSSQLKEVFNNDHIEESPFNFLVKPDEEISIAEEMEFDSLDFLNDTLEPIV